MNAIERYVAANQELEEARRHVGELARTLRHLGHHLDNRPAEVAILGLPGEPAPSLADRIGPACRSWQAGDVPDAATIQRALIRRHDAIEAARLAFEAVPEQMRSSLQAPRLV